MMPQLRRISKRITKTRRSRNPTMRSWAAMRQSVLRDLISALRFQRSVVWVRTRPAALLRSRERSLSALALHAPKTTGQPHILTSPTTFLTGTLILARGETTRALLLSARRWWRRGNVRTFAFTLKPLALCLSALTLLAQLVPFTPRTIAFAFKRVATTIIVVVPVRIVVVRGSIPLIAEVNAARKEQRTGE